MLFNFKGIVAPNDGVCSAMWSRFEKWCNVKLKTTVVISRVLVNQRFLFCIINVWTVLYHDFTLSWFRVLREAQWLNLTGCIGRCCQLK